MVRSGHPTALTEQVVRFQEEVERLALAAAREIVQQELDRRRPELPGLGAAGAAATRAPATGRGRGRADRGRAASPVIAAAPPEPGHQQLALPLAQDAAPAAEPPREPAKPTVAPAAGNGRRKWTRETIVEELATWMLSGTAIDAAFVTRHGPPGLVAAARRVFGRFEAALNVAGLRVSQLYPDGPPDR